MPGRVGQVTTRDELCQSLRADYRDLNIREAKLLYRSNLCQAMSHCVGTFVYRPSVGGDVNEKLDVWVAEEIPLQLANEVADFGFSGGISRALIVGTEGHPPKEPSDARESGNREECRQVEVPMALGHCNGFRTAFSTTPRVAVHERDLSQCEAPYSLTRCLTYHRDGNPREDLPRPRQRSSWPLMHDPAARWPTLRPSPLLPPWLYDENED